MKEKVVLAYSGGLDTTAIIPWLKENYDYDVDLLLHRRADRATNWTAWKSGQSSPALLNYTFENVDRRVLRRLYRSLRSGKRRL